MRTIQELTRDTQILCDSDEQRTAVFALCEAAGYKMYLPEMTMPFDNAPVVIISPGDKKFFDDTKMNEKSEYFDTIPATEFLTDKKEEI